MHRLYDIRSLPAPGANRYYLNQAPGQLYPGVWGGGGGERGGGEGTGGGCRLPVKCIN